MSSRISIEVDKVEGNPSIVIAEVLKETAVIGCELDYKWETWITCFKSMGEAQVFFHMYVDPDKWFHAIGGPENALKPDNPFNAVKVRLRTLIVQEVKSK
jgi:hypothetical protein